MNRIDQVFICVAENDDGEGIMAMLRDGVWLPLLAPDEAQLKSVIPIADECAAATGKPYKLVRLATRTEVDPELYRVPRDVH